MNLPRNPYVAGAPLRGEQGFFGRQVSMEWVQRELRNPQTNALVLFGQRRIGKTTLLLQLARSLPPDEFLSIYFDLQDQATRPLGQTLRDLAEILCEKADLDFGEFGPFDDQGRYFQKEFLPQFYTALGDQRRPVFLLDEFDILDQTAEAALVETATAKALFPLLRRLITSDARSAFVFVVGRRAEDLSLDFSATFKASLVREVWVLDDKSGEELVRQAEYNGTLLFTEDAIGRILGITNCHPYLTQLLCQRIWELAYASRPSAAVKIDTERVEMAMVSSLEAGNQALDWLWNGLHPAEKIYASALAEIAGENETIPEERIIEVLATHAARLRTREIELAPRDLVKRHVLNSSGERGYRFAVELFRRWVHKNKPLIVVKDEVDRIDPLADRLFMFGNGFYDARQWEKAANFFREALGVNPRHFRARLYLGETLLEQGKIDEAISELDQALNLDREEARLPLARAWLAKAEKLESDGDLDLLIEAYQRVLELSPKESQAVQGRVSVWLRRAKHAEESGDLSVALESYRQAGDQSSIDRLEKREHERLLKNLHEQAQQDVKNGRWEAAVFAYTQIVDQAKDDDSRLVWQTELEKVQAQAAEVLAKAKAQKIEEMKALAQAHEQREEWKQAVLIYDQLIEIDGQDNWNPMVENVHREQDMAAIFEQGQQALAQEDWKEAQSLFVKLLQERPDYRRNGLFAVTLMEDAVTHRKRRSLRFPNWLPLNRRLFIQSIVVSGLVMFLFVASRFSFFNGLVPTNAPIDPSIISTSAVQTARAIITVSTEEPTVAPTEIPSTPFPPAYNPHRDASDYVDDHGVSMRLIEAGEFTMGSESGQPDESPSHQVSLKSFYIDKYEVTNALYRSCVEAGECKTPYRNRSFSRTSYYAVFGNYPVIEVDWDMAKTYCEWRGGNLPTEAQWEKSARGPDGLTYPWGENFEMALANYEFKYGDTIAVGRLSLNKSTYGVYDMAGNVSEWVIDWYSRTYYQSSPVSDPTGPSEGLYRVYRGGAWNSRSEDLRTTKRSGNKLNAGGYAIGFRCVKSPIP